MDLPFKTQAESTDTARHTTPTNHVLEVGVDGLESSPEPKKAQLILIDLKTTR